MTELLSVEEMYRADGLAMAGGVAGVDLMAAAGAAVARVARLGWSPRPVAVLCGPGNNGGDGFVAARLLAARGWPVRLALLGDRDRLKGDASFHAARWTGRVLPLGVAALDRAGLVIDALFGAGLARPLDGPAAAAIDEVNRRRLPCLAVDVPSGVHGDTGAVMGTAPACAATVTFFRPKPGHFLRPGRDLRGRLHVAEIGIPETALEDIRPAVSIDGPGLWLDGFPWPGPDSHKYARGHLLVLGGGVMTGAARLAVRGARRMGAGLVSVAAPTASVPLHAADAPGVIVLPCDDAAAWRALLADGRRNVVLAGPGAGVGEATRRFVLEALATGRPCVLDADALTSFEGRAADLFANLNGRCLLTPHAGEFARLFPHLAGDRLSRAREAAFLGGAVVLLKGSDTVIAAPDGRAAILPEAPAWLASGGTGDVLAGMAAGLAGQGMATFEAACAAAWCHAEAARRSGPGMIAEDLPEALPAVLAGLAGR